MAKFLVNIDLNQNEIQNVRLQQLASDPGSPLEGQIWQNTTSDLVKIVLNGTTRVLGANSDSTPGTLTVSGVGSAGTSNEVARVDHTHPMPGTATTGASGFMSSTDKTKLDNATSSNTNSTLVIRDGSARFQAADPSAAQDVATKNYVDTMAQGLDAKASVVVATTANITNLSGGAPLVVDTVTVTTNDRVLVKSQSTLATNGLYIVQTPGSGSNGTWVRASDADTWSELISAYVWVEKGSANGDSGWLCTVDAGGTINTTDVTWVQFSGAGQITAGAGLTKTGNTIDVVSHAGTAGSIGTLTIGTDSIGVDLGSTSTTAAAGNHTHANMALTTSDLSQFAATTSAQLAGVISDETGYTTNAELMFNISPTVDTSLISGTSSFALVDTTATTVNFAGAATTLNIGHDGTSASTTGIATGALSSGTKVLNLATGASAGTTNVTIGATNAGTLTLNSPTVVSGVASLTLFDTTSTTINFAGAATTLNIGYDGTSAGSTTNIAVGAATTGTKTINLGTGGVSSSSTVINIGSTVSGSVTINGATLTLASFASAGFVKTNGSGVVSIDTNTYITSQSNDFGIISIDNTDTEYTWVTTDATTTTADTTQDTLKIVAAKTSATYGIEVAVDATNDAIGIRHKDTSSQATVDNSGNQQFIKSLTFDEFGHVTAATSGTPAGSVAKYSTDVGDNSSTSIVVTHNLGTTDVIVEVFDKSTPFERVYCDIRHTSTTTCTLVFAVAPTTNQYRCVVMG